MLPRKTKWLFVILNFYAAFSWSQPFSDEPYIWPDSKPVILPKGIETYSASDLVIVQEHADFYFYATNNEKIVKNVLLKINTASGLQQLRSYRLPESFDQGFDANLNKQGRRSKIKIPFIYDYHVTQFAARRLARNRWTDVAFNKKFEKLRWIGYTGEFVNDEITAFEMEGLAVGDVVELHYEAAFNAGYGSNLFYFHSAYPKLSCEYSFTYRMDYALNEYEFILPVNISDSLVKRRATFTKNSDLITKRIALAHLSGINYPANSCESKQLPHVFADFKFYRRITNSFPNNGGRVFEYEYVRPKNFEWMIYNDTVNNFTKIYDKQSAAIRKFESTLPKITNDSSKVIFFKALCDTLNNFRFVTANQLYYNESAIYEIYSGEHLLKRRLAEHMLWKMYSDLLNESKTFYYLTNVQDKRYGEHTLAHRAHYAYENLLVAIPSNNSYIYFMPRYDGIKYHLNELPFYYEGSLAALTARNFQEDISNKDSKVFKLLKTHTGTYNENTRTENATVRINTDSLKAGLVIKESLSGQFSTVLRHLYLNEYIDSTVPANYFKKCVDKPYAVAPKTKLSSKITEYPFRYTFACSEKINLQSKSSLDLRNWFSFIFGKSVIPEVPNHDYYFDFEFTDSYNFLLDFTAPTDITNLSGFSKKINNPYFDLESEIIKNSSSNYLLKVKIAVKQQKLPVENKAMLTEFVAQLDELNNFVLELKKG